MNLFRRKHIQEVIPTGPLTYHSVDAVGVGTSDPSDPTRSSQTLLIYFEHGAVRMGYEFRDRTTAREFLDAVTANIDRAWPEN